VIEDFFRLTNDVYNNYPSKAIPSELTYTILTASITALTILKEEPLLATFHFLRDFLAFGGPHAPVSSFEQNQSVTSVEIQQSVKTLISGSADPSPIGHRLITRTLTGLLSTFPPNVLPDASGLLLAIFQLAPTEAAQWVAQAVDMLPEGSISAPERERLKVNIGQRVESGEVRKVRALLGDFCQGWRRRNVIPREGLGGLEGEVFRFTQR
jgi:transportin-3